MYVCDFWMLFTSETMTFGEAGRSLRAAELYKEPHRLELNYIERKLLYSGVQSTLE